MKTYSLVAFSKRCPFQAEVQLEKEKGILRLQYTLTGPLAELELPDRKKPERTDELWKSTCFELFLQDNQQKTSYLEWNFSPSGDFAHYAFKDYRKADKPDPDGTAVQHCKWKKTEKLELFLDLDISAFQNSGFGNLSIVLLDKKGKLEYFALSHPEEKADFHNFSEFQKLY